MQNWLKIKFMYELKDNCRRTSFPNIHVFKFFFSIKVNLATCVVEPQDLSFVFQN